MTNNYDKLESLTSELLQLIGEDINRDGLIKTPMRVAKAWDYFSQGSRTNIDDVINNAIFTENCKDCNFAKKQIELTIL